MEWVQEGSVTTPAGFRVGSARCGIKTTADQPDVALIVSDGPVAAAGTFTQNRFASPAVRWCRNRLPASEVRAIAVNAGIANACTGRQGERNVEETARLTAELVECRPEQVLVASTGQIGTQLPMARLREGIRKASAQLSASVEAGRAAERAIMTTDTHPKACAVRTTLNGAPFHVGGMAKGAGMISPHMATMLCFVTTDAAVPADMLQEALVAAVRPTLNRVTVDGDTSTNDTVLVLASGASGAAVGRDGSGLDTVAPALEAVLGQLAVMIASDGEGASKLLTVKVTGAASEQDAERAARAIAESPLVKCAVYGADPNWGRIVCALGYCGARLDTAATVVRIGDMAVFDASRTDGPGAGAEAMQQAEQHMQEPEVLIHADLGAGTAEATVLGCDLTEDYVRINAHYHT
ncbi:MAG: bifunctional glutamate N-acetyltransferase/amino-acid acetyltransferase ArgJ [Candidatus Brocadiia bacterium]